MAFDVIEAYTNFEPASIMFWCILSIVGIPYSLVMITSKVIHLAAVSSTWALQSISMQLLKFRYVASPICWTFETFGGEAILRTIVTVPSTFWTSVVLPLWSSLSDRVDHSMGFKQRDSSNLSGITRATRWVSVNIIVALYQVFL